MFFHKPRELITLFHKPGFAPSIRVLTLLKQVTGEANATATIDQASDHSHQSKIQRYDFDLDVTEEEPTQDQLRNILEYAGNAKAQEIVEGASSVSDALQKLKEDRKRFKFPVTVDWANGKTVVGDNESEILKLLETLPKAK